MNIATACKNIVPNYTKWAFTTRRVVKSDIAGISTEFSCSISGDLVLGKIIQIGQHKKIQLAEGRTSESYIGDYVVLTCGDRYAPDQFEGVAQLDSDGADLLAGGGLIGKMQLANDRMIEPTRIQPLGLLSDKDNNVINVERYALSASESRHTLPVIGVVGSSMNSGKTTAVASLAFGLRNTGLKVATIKITGTGAFGDFNAFHDAGSSVVLDFTDAGMASTYRQPIERIDDGFDVLLGYAEKQGAQIAIVELADGIFQDETAALLKSSRIRDSFLGVLFTAGDALSVVGGVNVLRKIGLKPFAVSGKVTRSPLAASEAVANANISILSREQLRDPSIVRSFLNEFIDISGMVSSKLCSENRAA